MKELLFMVSLFSICSCVDKKSINKNENILAELKAYEDSKSAEENAGQLMEDYIKDVNASDWKSKTT